MLGEAVGKGQHISIFQMYSKHLTPASCSTQNVPIILGDITDQASLDSIASQSKVVIATAGPFARYGTPVVDACVRSGADYCDITGKLLTHHCWGYFATSLDVIMCIMTAMVLGMSFFSSELFRHMHMSTYAKYTSCTEAFCAQTQHVSPPPTHRQMVS